jgi:hypothetical protein
MTFRARCFQTLRISPLLARLSQLEGVATREAAPEEDRGQKVCTTGAILRRCIRSLKAIVFSLLSLV